jgi:Cysteine-rich secretory protein family
VLEYKEEIDIRKRIKLIILVLISIPFIAIAVGELGDLEKQELLAAQNRYRAEVNVSPLIWSDTLAAQAQKCADFNAANPLPQGRQRHCPTSGTGQNIAQATSVLRLTLAQMVDLWGKEKQYFINGDYPSVSSTGSPGSVSHYTQMIWQDTGEVGCGKANASGSDFLVCDYSPQGNVNGTVVYAAPRPQPVKIGETNAYMNLRSDSASASKRRIILNTVHNRPVSCYPPTPV